MSRSSIGTPLQPFNGTGTRTSKVDEELKKILHTLVEEDRRPVITGKGRTNSCTRSAQIRSSNMVFESDEPQPHRPITGTGTVDDEVERGPENLIPQTRRRLHLATIGGKLNPKPKET
jgi:hypothetical protein